MIAISADLTAVVANAIGLKISKQIESLSQKCDLKHLLFNTICYSQFPDQYTHNNLQINTFFKRYTLR